jgi:hypothetical protein
VIHVVMQRRAQSQKVFHQTSRIAHLDIRNSIERRKKNRKIEK